MVDPLVSIIMPAYNAQKFIRSSIASVLNQTYSDWELIVVDDASTDSTADMVEQLTERDDRIKIIKLKQNSGAAVARNTAIKSSVGQYIAFLDCDDIWNQDKLKVQVHFMETGHFQFSCTYYDKIDENSQSLNTIVKYPSVSDYKTLLKYVPGNSTVMYDADTLGKFYIPNIRKRNDYIMWLQIIKDAKKIYCVNQVLSSYRLSSASLSSKKVLLVKYHWKIYRKYENMSFIRSLYLVAFWIVKGMKKVMN